MCAAPASISNSTMLSDVLVPWGVDAIEPKLRPNSQHSAANVQVVNKNMIRIGALRGLNLIGNPPGKCLENI
jgi:hypothetical protein